MEPGARWLITRPEADTAQTAFDREKNDYYLDRYEELEKLQLLPVARAVADAFEARALLDDAAFGAAVVEGVGSPDNADEVTAAKDAMRDLGYVWRPEATPMWEPGIPSLMDYVREFAPAG